MFQPPYRELFYTKYAKNGKCTPSEPLPISILYIMKFFLLIFCLAGDARAKDRLEDHGEDRGRFLADPANGGGRRIFGKRFDRMCHSCYHTNMMYIHITERFIHDNILEKRHVNERAEMAQVCNGGIYHASQIGQHTGYLDVSKRGFLVRHRWELQPTER